MLQTFLIVVVVGAVTGYLLRAGGRPVARSAGSDRVILAYGPAFRAIGWVGVVVAGAIPVLALVWAPGTRGDLVAVVAMCTGFLTLGVVLLNESRLQVVLSPESTRAHSPWRGQLRISWNEVVSVRYSSVSQWFVIRGRSGTVIRVHNYLPGIPTLLEYFRDKLDEELYGDAAAAYGKLTGQSL